VKDKSFLAELALTFSLFYLIIFLLRDALSIYGLYIIFGLISGFCFSWFIREKPNPWARVLMNLVAVGIFVWIIYSLLNSSLLYREVMRIFSKGALFFAVVFSFNAYNSRSLTYLQALSIPLFMCSPLFIKDYNAVSLISISGYFIGWFIIFKVKFYGFFKPAKEKKPQRYHPLYLALIFFIIILVSSWTLFSNFPLREIKAGGFFPLEGVPEEETGLEKEYYALQSRVQDKITRIIPELNSTEDRYEVLELLSSLLKESPYTVEVEKAESGLITQLAHPGPGLEKRDTPEMTFMIKNYVDKKILINLKRNKDGMIDVLKKYLFDIKNRISILSRVNKIQYGDSYEKLDKSSKELKKNINNAFASGSIKREMGGLVRQLKEWKVFELYREKMNALNQAAGSAGGELKKELAGLPQEIGQLGEAADFRKTGNKLEGLKERLPAQLKEPVNEIFNLKLEMSVSEKARSLKSKLEIPNLSGDKITELKELVDDIEDAEGYQDLSKNSSELQVRITAEDIDTPKKEIAGLLEIKTYRLVKEEKEKIAQTLKEGILPDAQREDFLKGLEKLESAQDAEKVISGIEKSRAAIDKFLEQGFINQGSKENLAKETEEFKDLLLFQLTIKEKEMSREEELFSAQKRWEEMIEKSPLSEEAKQLLKRLSEEFSRADTFSKLESVRQAIEKEIESLAQEPGLEKEAEKLKEAFSPVVQMQRMYVIDKSLFSLKRSIDKLEELDYREKEILKEYLKTIRNSSTEEEFKRRLEALKNYLDSKELKKEEKSQEKELISLWKIYIMPSQLVVPVGSSVLLKAIGVYENMFIKELGAELEWSSSNPNAVWVNEKGLVYALFKGKAKISALYRGKVVEGAEVIVVDQIPKGIGEAIKRDLKR
jgi:hypothetical protein